MKTAFDLEDYLAAQGAHVESALARSVEALDGRLDEDVRLAIRHGVLSGGKRIRPILCVTAYRAAGGTACDEHIYDLAASLELIHAYSLMHDDLPCMDDAELRRGKPTTHYLEEAKARAEAEQLDIEFVHEDARSFHRPDTFDVVINLYTSFGYFEAPSENMAVLDNIYASLKPGGKLLMELMGKEVLARIFQERDWRQEDDAILLEERKVGKNWDFIEARWILFKGGKKYEHTFYPKLYSAMELCEMLSRSGFREMETFGGLDGSPYDQNANRLTVLGCK